MNLIFLICYTLKQDHLPVTYLQKYQKHHQVQQILCWNNLSAGSIPGEKHLQLSYEEKCYILTPEMVFQLTGVPDRFVTAIEC